MSSARNRRHSTGGERQRPNVLWYCTDQQRFDTIHGLGNPEINTPRLDAFLEQSVAFTSAYTQCPICTPSRASFLTGRYPASHHVHRNGNERFPDDEVLVTRLFQDAGYHCGLAGKLHIAGAQKTGEVRTDDGYSFYEWSHHPYPDVEGNRYTHWLRQEKGIDPDALFSQIEGAYGVGPPTELHQTTWCTEMAMRFIGENTERPWLLSVNPFSPHPTFHPPKEYLQRYDPEQLSYPLFRPSDIERQRQFGSIDQQTYEARDPRTKDLSGSKEQSLPRDQLASIPPTDYDARLLKACYYAEIELIDHQFGRLLDYLQETGQLENTIVIFMSDHGELLGDHGLLYKGCRFFESLVHVPLIFSWPRKLIKDVKSPALVELVDIAPTLLELSDIEVPEYIQGRSLAPLLQGSTETDWHKSHVVSEYNDAMSAGTCAAGPFGYRGSHGTMYFDGRYKSVVYQDQDIGEIFDLQNDPGEFTNLWTDPEFHNLKCDLVQRHLDALMATSDAGVRRTKDY